MVYWCTRFVAPRVCVQWRWFKGWEFFPLANGLVSAWCLPGGLPGGLCNFSLRSHAPTAASRGRTVCVGYFRRDSTSGSFCTLPPARAGTELEGKHTHTQGAYRGPSHRKSFIRQKRSINGPDSERQRAQKTSLHLIRERLRLNNTQCHAPLALVL